MFPACKREILNNVESSGKFSKFIRVSLTDCNEIFGKMLWQMIVNFI